MTDHGNINPETLAAIQGTYGPDQRFCLDDADDIQHSPGWYRDQNRAWTAQRLPRRYAAATIERAEIHEWVLTVCRDPETARSLMLTGATGTGKTHAAFAALRLSAESIRPTTWRATNTAEFLGDLRPSAGRDSEAAMNAYAKASLLFLDDLGAAKLTEWGEEAVYRLVDYRYTNCRPTLFATNLVPTALGEYVGDRTASRLAGMCDVVAFKGPDRRLT